MSRRFWIVAFALGALGCSARQANEPEPTAPRYVFSWPFVDTKDLAPRGGTTRGAPVTLANGPTEDWQKLRQPGLSAFDRDRAAILAMAGDYRASFDFLETVVFAPPYQPAKPYRSWGTERVYVAEDRGDFISLQHVLLMLFVDDDGKVQGPFVQKHWRQDWQWEPKSIHEHAGKEQWKRRDLSASERRGAWSQSVYQVDDSPRYASVGRWEHRPSFSAWTGGRTGRPLPRREHTVRDDYDLLEAVNRHTILPAGWVHEEDNVKVVLEGPGAKAREVGVNRYERLSGFDFSVADAYWGSTGPFWVVVREAWAKRLSDSKTLRISTTCEGKPAFEPFFAYAAKLEAGPSPSREEMRTFVDEQLDCIVTNERG
ncbi:MAG: hypothetical protein FJ144_04675 [Deltaproteobacteria bacterium]|nr:hypothetical protein [Deltaproteobacteria bacterium]